MNYLTFRETMFNYACFSIHQAYSVFPGFDRNNLLRWVRKGYLVKLRQGWYTFSEYKEKSDYSWYFANKIYAPSYISLHTALAFYGIIPEGVAAINSVSSLKTVSFRNDFGTFTYNSVKEDLLFGYVLKSLPDGRTIQLATPEKAIMDLLYLYPFYKTAQDMLDLRMDDDFLHDDLDKERLHKYVEQAGSKALRERAGLFIKAYEL